MQSNTFGRSAHEFYSYRETSGKRKRKANYDDRRETETFKYTDAGNEYEVEEMGRVLGDQYIKLDEQFCRLRKQFRQLETEHSDCYRREKDLEHEIRKRNDKIHNLQQESGFHAVEMKRKSQKYAQYLDDISHLHKIDKEKDWKIKCFRSSRDKSEKTVIDLKREVSEQESLISKLKSDLREKSHQIEDHERKLKITNSKILHKETILQDENNQLLAKVKVLEIQNKEIISQSQNKDKKIAEYEHMMGTLPQPLAPVNVPPFPPMFGIPWHLMNRSCDSTASSYMPMAIPPPLPPVNSNNTSLGVPLNLDAKNFFAGLFAGHHNPELSIASNSLYNDVSVKIEPPEERIVVGGVSDRICSEAESEDKILIEGDNIHIKEEEVGGNEHRESFSFMKGPYTGDMYMEEDVKFGRMPFDVREWMKRSISLEVTSGQSMLL